jgi:hypothetical protein
VSKARKEMTQKRFYKFFERLTMRFAVILFF